MLLLFDIDGTLLLRASRAHRDAVYEGLRTVYGAGIADTQVATAGRTDPAIARSILVAGGVDAKTIDDGLPAWRDAVVEAYARLCPADLSATVAPGAGGAVAELGAAGHALSLVTGNLEPVARLKLGRAGLGHLFPTGQGGFGSDHEDRSELPAVARGRAGGHPREDTVVIGDTPLDIACARADGVRVVAVATGPHPAAELRDADAVIGGLAELAGALEAL